LVNEFFVQHTLILRGLGKVCKLARNSSCTLTAQGVLWPWF
jgi:hypothetical protein